MTRNFEEDAKEAEEYGVKLSDIPEDDRLDCWPWSKKYLDEINADMSRGAFDSMLEMLDKMGVPKGTYSDDRLMNFIAMYNRRGEVIKILQDRLSSLQNKEPIDESYAHLLEYSKLLEETLTELANWYCNDDNETARGMKVVAASVVDPSKVKILNILFDKVAD